MHQLAIKLAIALALLDIAGAFKSAASPQYGAVSALKRGLGDKALSDASHAIDDVKMKPAEQILPPNVPSSHRLRVDYSKLEGDDLKMSHSQLVALESGVRRHAMHLHPDMKTFVLETGPRKADRDMRLARPFRSRHEQYISGQAYDADGNIIPFMEAGGIATRTHRIGFSGYLGRSSSRTPYTRPPSSLGRGASSSIVGHDSPAPAQDPSADTTLGIEKLRLQRRSRGEDQARRGQQAHRS
ncbi:hypothetical protein IE81DRAFT_350488 [Ceraceosorus guamensis]|uniref:Uncharacterized protein n=1 Tax=Ceraceosorus guamensis TaxID=1522189 RepID=A0A316VRP5_9BASI|nr:hypothetical protein IE81DRAFT_350488 [Ceraceosorus guamensis]PWN39083.1 hypothetical protein IE81DRAFT_350488 [Ceraceosorus guamensis]